MSAKIAPGSKAPIAQTRPVTAAADVSLSDFKGRKLVLYRVYPKADTSGCTVEAKDFTRLAPATCAKRRNRDHQVSRRGPGSPSKTSSRPSKIFRHRALGSG